MGPNWVEGYLLLKEDRHCLDGNVSTLSVSLMAVISYENSSEMGVEVKRCGRQLVMMTTVSCGCGHGVEFGECVVIAVSANNGWLLRGLLFAAGSLRCYYYSCGFC